MKVVRSLWFLLLAYILTQTTALAQVNKFGVNFRLGIGTHATTVAPKLDSYYAFGMGFHIPMTQYFGLRPELTLQYGPHKQGFALENLQSKFPGSSQPAEIKSQATFAQAGVGLPISLPLRDGWALTMVPQAGIYTATLQEPSNFRQYTGQPTVVYNGYTYSADFHQRNRLYYGLAAEIGFIDNAKISGNLGVAYKHFRDLGYSSSDGYTPDGTATAPPIGSSIMSIFDVTTIEVYALISAFL